MSPTDRMCVACIPNLRNTCTTADKGCCWEEKSQSEYTIRQGVSRVKAGSCAARALWKQGQKTYRISEGVLRVKWS